jgi:hypothetical protein
VEPSMLVKTRVPAPPPRVPAANGVFTAVDALIEYAYDHSFATSTCAPDFLHVKLRPDLVEVHDRDGRDSDQSRGR